MRLLLRHRRSVGIAAAAVLAAGTATLAGPASQAAAGTSPGPPVPGVNCQPEQFPDAGAPRSSAFVPYEIPFSATLGPDPAPPGVFPASNATPPVYPANPQGGYLEIDGKSRSIPGATVKVVLGGPIVNGRGQIYARSCGTLQLPTENGGIGANQYVPIGNGGEANPNFLFSPAIPVSVGISLPGITVPSGIVAYGESDGFLASDILPTPAHNGGMDLDFYATAKSTTNLSALVGMAQALGLASPSGSSDCTVTIGDLATAGVPVPPGGIAGLSYAAATRPVHLTTKTSGAYTGQPVTGPIAPNAQGRAQDTATLVSNDFPIAQILPQMPPARSFPGGADCSSSNAQMLNDLIGLPTQPGQAVFVAPSTFGVYTSR